MCDEDHTWKHEESNNFRRIGLPFFCPKDMPGSLFADFRDIIGALNVTLAKTPSEISLNSTENPADWYTRNLLVHAGEIRAFKKTVKATPSRPAYVYLSCEAIVTERAQKIMTDELEKAIQAVNAELAALRDLFNFPI